MNNLGKSKKLTAVFLAMLMAFSLMAMPALAAEDSASGDSSVVSESFASESIAVEPDSSELEEEDEIDEGDEPVVEAVEETDSSSSASNNEEEGSAGEDTEKRAVQATQQNIMPLSGSVLTGIAELSAPTMKVNGENYTPGTPITINKNTTIVLDYTWKLKDGVVTNDLNKGDSTVLGTLPANLPFASDLTKLSIDIKAADNVTVIGIVTFDAVGNIILTFTDEIKNMTNVAGRFSITSSIDFNELTVPGDTAVLVMSDEGKFTIEATGDAPVELEKRFVGAYMGDEPRKFSFDTLEWEIDINTKQDIVTPAVVTDEVSFTPEGRVDNNTFVSGLHRFGDTYSVEVYELEVYENAFGHVVVTPGNVPIDKSRYTVKPVFGKEDTAIEIDLGGIEGGNQINKAYRIVVRTTVDLTRVPHREGTTFVYKNTATLGDISKSDIYEAQNQTHNTKFGNFITASWNDPAVPFVKDDTYIRWALLVNRANVKYGETTVKDILPEGLSFALGKDNEVYFQIQQFVFNDETKDISEVGPLYYSDNITAEADWNDILTGPPVLGTEVDKDGKTHETVKFTFKNLDKVCYRVYLYTSVEETAEFVRDGYKNEMVVTIDADMEVTKSTTVYAPTKWRSSTLSKKALQNEITLNTMSWELTYNTLNGYTAHGLEIQDNYYNWVSVPMELIEESLVVTLDGDELTEGKEYTLDLEDWDQSPETGSTKTYWFDLIFNIDIPSGSTIVVYYKTKYTGRNNSVGFGEKITDTFYNQAFSTAYMSKNGGSPATEITKLSSGQVSQKITYEVSVNGIKVGTFDRDEEDNVLNNISWTVDFNRNKYNFGGENITLKDEFGDNQMFVGNIDNLLVYEVGSDGNETLLEYETDYFLLKDNKNVNSIADKSIINDSRTGFILLFPNMRDQHYRLVYKTAIYDPSVPLFQYTNNVIARKTNGAELWFDAQAKKPADGNVLAKNAVPEPGDADLWHWTINLNGSKGDLKNAVVTDNMSPGLRLVEDSIVVKTASGTIKELEKDKDYKLAVEELSDGRTSFEISFIGEYKLLQDAVNITYDTRLDAGTAIEDEKDPSKYFVSNEVILVAEEIVFWETKTETVTITSGEGSATGKDLVRLTIKKIDAETKETHIDLEGTTFKLYAANGAVVMEDIKIRDIGYSNPISLEKGIYYLVETQAADGFEEITGRIEIDLSEAGKTFELVVENTRKPVEPGQPLKVIKTALDKKVVLGNTVTFEIEVQNPNAETMHDITLYDWLDKEIFEFVGGGEKNGSLAASHDKATGMVTWGLFDLEGGQSKIFTLTVKTLKLGDHNNVAIAISEEMEGGSTDPESPDLEEDNVDEDDVTVVEPAQPLKVIKTALDKKVVLGNTVTFEIEVQNPNAETMHDITLYDWLDKEIFEFVSGGEKNGSLAASHDKTTGMVTWGLFDLEGGQSKIFTLTVKTLKLGDHNNVAIAISEEMEGGSTDPESPDLKEDNVDEDDVTVVEPAQPLKVTKTALDKKVVLGDTVTFEIEVNNPNAETMHDITLYDWLDKEIFEFVGGGEKNGSLAASHDKATGMVTWGLFDLEGGQSKTFTLTVKTLKEGKHNNVAIAISEEMEGGSTDPEAPDLKEDNVDEDDVTVEKPVPPATTRPETSKPSTSRPSTTSSSSSSSSEPTSEPPVEPPVTPASSAPTTSRRVVVSSSSSSSSSGSSSSTTSSSSSEAPVAPESTPGSGEGGTGGTGGGGEDTPTLEGTIVPDVGSGNNTEDLSFAGVPLGGLSEGAAWSLLNLLMSVLSLLTGVVLLVGMLRRRKLNEQEDEDEMDAAEEGEQETEERRRRLLGLRLPAIFMAIAPGVLFLIFENIRLPMTWITRWTPLIGAAFIVHMALVLVHFVVTKRTEEEEPDDADGQMA